MSLKALSEEDRKNLQLIFNDLKKLFSVEQIDISEIDNFTNSLQSPEVKSYISSLKEGTKAETALRESFFAGQALLSRYLASEMSPEVNTGDGFIDYKLYSGKKFVMMELKPLFETETRETKGGRETVKIKQKKLDWKKHTSQIVKYIRSGGEFTVITDLKDWYFFDDSVNLQECKPFLETNFQSLEKDFSVGENFYDLILRYNFASIREELDKVFFSNLKVWVEKILEVNFEVDEKRKMELALGIINKFIFIQTLDDYGVVEFRWIQTTWEYAEQRWGSRSKYEVLRQFFDDTINWFYNYYDTELFTENPLQFLKKDSDNIDKFYNNLRMILGLTYWQTALGGYKGVMQYKFRFIDEDILGKAYETYLGGIRHDEGVYYTPKYITQYIVDNTVGKLFDSKTQEIKKYLIVKDFDNARNHIIELTKIKVIDPACGSGSFLIKSVREIWKKYADIATIIEQMLAKTDMYDTLTRNPKIEEEVSKIKSLKKLIGFETKRELISKLLLRHIYGNDLDPRAVAVAKVNLWLEAVKISSSDFRYDRLPVDTNRILPHLEMNLVNGDAVIGLSDKEVINYLEKNHKETLSNLSKLRQAYLDNPTDPHLIDKIEEEKQKIRNDLMIEFSKHLSNKGISQEISKITIPFFWPLELWFAYFQDSTTLPEDSKGMDCVVGNPPYVRIQVLKKKSPDYGTILDDSGFVSTGNYDLATIFIEKGYSLLKKNGEFGYIVTNKFMQGDYGRGIRGLLSKQKAVKEIIDFGDQQVFNEATTYTALVFLKNTAIENMKYCLVKKLKEDSEQMNKIQENDNLDESDLTLFNVKNETLTDEPWVFLSSYDDNVIKKTQNMKTLGDIAEQIFVGLQTSADTIYIVEGVERDTMLEITSKVSGKKYTVEKEPFKKILTGKDIKRWFINWRHNWLFFPYRISGDTTTLIEEQEMQKKYPKTWEYLVDHKPQLDERENGSWSNVQNWHKYVYEKNLDMFSKPKILTGVLASRSSFTLDKEGTYYFVGGGNAGGYGIALKKESPCTLEYLVGLLNSTFLDWMVRKKTSKFHGGYFSYAKRFIEDLPIQISESEQEKALSREIERNVSTIFSKMDDSRILEGQWSKWSEQMKDTEKTLLKILEDEEENIKGGDNEHLWFEETSFFISKGKEILNETFDEFRISGNSNKISLEIIGIKDGIENSLYTMKFKDKSNANHFCLSLRKSLDSRAKINSLKDVFEKTIIPVLQPNASKKTINIMIKVMEESGKLSKSTITSFLEIMNEIEETEAKTDALIFKAYKIEPTQMNFVMNSMALHDSYQIKVNNYYSQEK